MYKNISIFVPSKETISRRRFLNWLGGIAIMPVVSNYSAHAQTLGKLELGDSVCDYIGDEEMPKSVHFFQSSQEAEEVIAEITSINGLNPNFKVQAAGVPNAAAVIHGEERYILYSRTFMRDMERQVGTPWAPKSIMAHEVGHHFGGHTLKKGGSRHELELDADSFSGSMLEKMGASLDEAQAAMKKLASKEGSSTHPRRQDRLEAIASGWYGSCDRRTNAEGCREGQGRDDIRPDPAPKPDPEPGRSGPNSCEYANDGHCDEPEICARGTDTADCRAPEPPPPPPPQQTPASACCDPYTGQPVCQMAVPLPRGVTCHCSGIPGSGVTCY